jgi:hypothetical protein
VALKREGNTAILNIEPFATLTQPERDALIGEGLGLLAFAAADAHRYDVRSPKLAVTQPG